MGTKKSIYTAKATVKQEKKNLKAPEKLATTDNMSATTKKVIANYNSMSSLEFVNKYYVSKATYAKRVEKWVDPYKHATTSTSHKILTSDAVQKVTNSKVNQAYTKRVVNHAVKSAKKRSGQS